ncbi:MAG: hypothetical protein M5R40_07050 [Anaerolineae bacterium]|nr:hypothetical protein [Anaerolineae bacterium]
MRTNPLNENLVVLGRMYCQLSGLETEFLARGIPYRVLGRAPFFERREIQVLLDYVRLAARLGLAADATSSKLLLSVANTPNRMLSKLMLERTFVLAQSNGYSTREALHSLLGSRSFLTSSQRTRADDLVTFIERLWERITQEAGLNAGDLLEWMVAGLDYYAHFDNYYGKGESSEDRKRAVAYFCSYGRGIGLEPLNFVAHVESLDTTRGVPEKDQILMTTVFRTKGLEFDYVVIPACEEGYMPCLFGSGNTGLRHTGNS